MGFMWADKRVNTAFKSFRCCSGVGLAISTSSIYTYADGIPRNTWSMNLWNVWAAFRSPNGILTNLKSPKGVVTAVLGMSSGATGIWW